MAELDGAAGFAAWIGRLLGLRPRRSFARAVVHPRWTQPPAIAIQALPDPRERLDPDQPAPACPREPTAAQRRAAALAAFNPAQPVENRLQLCGRDQELRQLRHVLLDMSAHALVYGDRGAGKTSLVRAFGDYADEHGRVVIYLACGGDTRFPELFRPYLDELAEALPDRAEADALRARIAALPPMFGARDFCALLGTLEEHAIVFIVDEFDRIRDAATREEIATLLKLLADARVPVQLLLAGIADDISGLVESHPSLRRHLVGIPLRRFDDAGVADLFARGARVAGMSFSLDAQVRIAALAAGSPYHLRLFCFSTAAEAIERNEGQVSAATVDAGLRTAFDMWASTSAAAADAFQRLAERGPPMRERLRAFAISCLLTDGQSDGAGPITAEPLAIEVATLLAPLLDHAQPAHRRRFADSLAPQFLLVACHLARDVGEEKSDDERNEAVLSKAGTDQGRF